MVGKFLPISRRLREPVGGLSARRISPGAHDDEHHGDVLMPKSVIAPGRIIRVGRGPSYASVEALREARARRPRRVPSKHFRPGYRSAYGKIVEGIIAQAKIGEAFSASLRDLGEPDQV